MLFYARKSYLVILLATSIVAALEEEPRNDNKARLVAGNVRTTTLWNISAVTSTRYRSCLSGIVTNMACPGKRRKKRDSTYMQLVDDDENSRNNVDGSLSETELAADSNRDEKLYGFTVWTAVTQATTVTVLSTATDTTIRISFICTAALLGGDAFATCG